MQELLQSGLRRVALIDDKKDETINDSVMLRRLGFEPFYLPGPFSHVEELIDQVRLKADLALCDHSLQKGGYAPFFGAEAVAALYDLQIPAILVTAYYDIDVNESIRLKRRQIPSLLRKKDVSDKSVSAGITSCLEEFQGSFSPERQPCRTLIEIARIDESEQAVDVFVLSWDSEVAVRFPQSLLPGELQQTLEEGQLLEVTVNTGAINAQDLYFVDFAKAPDPVAENIIG